MSSPRVEFALKKLYGRLAGELAWIEKPPKTMARKSRGREKFLAEASLRAARAEEIREALPHVHYVIGLYDPEWSPGEFEPIRPKAEWGRPVGPSFTGTALDVLREAERPLEISEIAARVAERLGIDLPDSNARQMRHTSVFQGLKRTYSDLLVHDGGSPQRWALKSRGLITTSDD